MCSCGETLKFAAVTEDDGAELITDTTSCCISDQLSLPVSCCTAAAESELLFTLLQLPGSSSM